MLAPTLSAAGGFEADKVAIRAKGVEKIGIHGWSRARAGIIGILLGTAYLAQGHRPEAVAVLGGKRQHEFVGETLVAEEINPPARN